MKKIIAVLLAAVMALSLAGCGLIEKLPTDGFDLPFGGTGVHGKYTCVSIVERPESNWKEPGDEIWIELEKSGEAVFFFEGYEYTLLWELEGSDIELSMGSETLISGTLDAGVMQVTYGDDCIMVLTARGVDAPSTESTVFWPGEEQGTEPVESVTDTAATEATEPVETEPVETEPVETEPTVTQPVITEPVFEPSVFDMGICTVSFVGAEQITTQDGCDAIRFYFDFTNNTDRSLSLYECVTVEAFQGGELCIYGYTDWDPVFSTKYEISDLSIRPGCTARNAVQFEADMAGDAVSLVFTALEDGSSCSVEVDPADLPGAPGEELELEPVTSPPWTAELSDRGVYNVEYYACIDSATFDLDWDGAELLKVRFEFTNNSSSSVSFWALSYIFAYQDGIQLRTGIPVAESAEDLAYYEAIAPGETIFSTVNFVLRSQSPVEIELVDFMSENGQNLGCVFNLAD